jgi:hypothetical protein
VITDFRLSHWLAFDVISVLGWLHHVDVVIVSDISGVCAVFIFRVGICRVGEFLHMYMFMFLKTMGGCECPLRASKDSRLGNLCKEKNDLLRASKTIDNWCS